ncbi:MAG: hypothetical protein ACO1QR_09770 [Chthoniobacteraceae bacterium]
MNPQIDITLTTEQKAGITTAIDALPTAMPFLLGYTPEERLRLPRLGPRRESFARLAIETAQQNPTLVPTSISLVEVQRDLELLEVLTSVRTRLQQILQQVDDTHHAAGRDVYAVALEIYGALKNHGRNSGLDDTLRQLKTRLRTPPTTEPEGEAEAGEGTALV